MTHLDSDGKSFKLDVGDTIELTETQAFARVGKVELVPDEELYGGSDETPLTDAEIAEFARDTAAMALLEEEHQSDLDVAAYEAQKQGKNKNKVRK